MANREKRHKGKKAKFKGQKTENEKKPDHGILKGLPFRFI
jgi:hypothetical protein